jgi:hypothetical protein
MDRQITIKEQKKLTFAVVYMPVTDLDLFGASVRLTDDSGVSD